MAAPLSIWDKLKMYLFIDRTSFNGLKYLGWKSDIDDSHNLAMNWFLDIIKLSLRYQRPSPRPSLVQPWVHFAKNEIYIFRFCISALVNRLWSRTLAFNENYENWDLHEEHAMNQHMLCSMSCSTCYFSRSSHPACATGKSVNMIASLFVIALLKWKINFSLKINKLSSEDVILHICSLLNNLHFSSSPSFSVSEYWVKSAMSNLVVIAQL